jgi:hypothetical protein
MWRPIGGRGGRDGTAAVVVKMAEAIEMAAVTITTAALTVNAAATLSTAAMAEAT